jgi:Flp pilus assembly pilin Flp
MPITRWDESGPTAVEYAVMLGFLVSVVLLVVQTIGSATGDLFKSSAAATAKVAATARQHGYGDGRGYTTP